MFKTTNEQKIQSYEIAIEMHKKGLPVDFITKVVELASEYEGAFDLMKIWIEEDSEEERSLVCKDLEEIIKDCSARKQTCNLP